TAADLRQRPLGQLLREIHADLARPDDGTMPSLRQQIPLRDTVVTRNDAQDIFDLDAARLDTLNQIADHGLGDIHRYRRAHVLPVGKQADDRTFQLATVIGEALG